jgi:hypothetical protein
VEDREVIERWRVESRPAKKFKQKGAQAVQGTVVNVPTLCNNL